VRCRFIKISEFPKHGLPQTGQWSQQSDFEYGPIISKGSELDVLHVSQHYENNTTSSRNIEHLNGIQMRKLR
jgi:hypothetical protein